MSEPDSDLSTIRTYVYTEGDYSDEHPVFITRSPERLRTFLRARYMQADYRISFSYACCVYLEDQEIEGFRGVDRVYCDELMKEIILEVLNERECRDEDEQLVKQSFERD